MKKLIKHLFLYLIMGIVTTIFALISPIATLYPNKLSYRLIAYNWARIFMFLLKHLFNLTYTIEGIEELNKDHDTPTIVVSNHQSIWETIAFIAILPPQTWVVKKELMWIPFYGWLLWAFHAIPINRSKTGSFQDLVKKSKKIIYKYKLWLVIFPQGTRVKFGEKTKFKKGGFILAKLNKLPILPIAHNAGKFWPRGLWIENSGTIQIKVHPKINTTEHEPAKLCAQVQEWIDSNSQM